MEWALAAVSDVAGMVAVITAVLAGAAIGLLAAVAFGHSLAAALIAGGVVSGGLLGALMRYQRFAWARAVSAPLSFDTDDAGSVRR